MPQEIYLVVISIYDGKNFPRRSKHRIVVECAFDGELLSTDPVDHAEAPEFAAELAWELNKKVLHQHRMQRTPIKLQCFAVTNSSAQRELIGYVLLDLRQAQLMPKEPRWYNLLSRKYPHQKSAIKVGISLENRPCHEDNSKTKDARRTSGQFSVKIDEEARYFQIGSSDKHCDMFVLSVTITLAANLEQLIPADRRLTSSNTGYFFVYTLLENDVIEDPFPDLLNPEFIPKRTSVRIRSSADMLREYLACCSGLVIHLCSSENSLGRACIPLSTLFESGSECISFEPLAIDGTFILCPPHIAEKELLETLGAKVGVSVNLSQETELPDSGKPLALVRETILNNAEPVCATTIKDNKQQHLKQMVSMQVIADAVRCTNLEEIEHSATAEANSSCRNEEMKLTKSDRTAINKGSIATDSESTNLTTSATRLAIPPQARHYRLSLHLVSIENLDLPNLCNAYLKYSYPFFGSAAPILISITTGICKGIDLKLSRSKCHFDFACTPSLLESTFSRVPLDLELWSKNSESDDILIATAVLPLKQLLVQKPVRYLMSCDVTQGSREGVKLSLKVQLGMKMVYEPFRRVCGLNVSLSLEDTGSVLKRKMLCQRNTLT